MSGYVPAFRSVTRILAASIQNHVQYHRSKLQARGLANLTGVPGIGGWQAPPSPTRLDQVVKMELFVNKTSKQIVDTWMKYHEDESKGRIATVLSKAEYGRFMKLATESPIFIMPLEKPEGYVTLLVQWQGPLAMFTTLQEFQMNPTSSNSHLTLTHYSEFADKKDLVLIRGDVSTPKVVNAFEAKVIAKRLYELYLNPEKYTKWVWVFNHASASFDFKAYFAELGFIA